MSSQETLVERVHTTSVFIFSRDDMRQTTISLRGHGPVYTVNSDQSSTRTSIFHFGDHVPLAVSEQRGILPDKITFRGQDRQKLKSWLKFSSVSLFPVTFEAFGRFYTWRFSARGELSMHSQEHPEEAIAWFTPSRRSDTTGSPTMLAASLTLKPDALEIQDLTVVSFLLLEQKSRTMSRPTGGVAGPYAFFVEALY
ncbi:hypothetical protein Hypma_002348 [Hypsizygus marmoreus]|uniref:DUF6593 domain-containing protein n=1 Tax=Hypsizygus marmoreus TaxID=39966 RepID=A0A369J8A5_HYPMA|nr:hypothetical protein Hypma_002348 [Hypsizygus marmoreus]